MLLFVLVIVWSCELFWIWVGFVFELDWFDLVVVCYIGYFGCLGNFGLFTCLWVCFSCACYGVVEFGFLCTGNSVA